MGLGTSIGLGASKGFGASAGLGAGASESCAMSAGGTMAKQIVSPPKPSSSNSCTLPSGQVSSVGSSWALSSVSGSASQA